MKNEFVLTVSYVDIWKSHFLLKKKQKHLNNEFNNVNLILL